MLSSMKLAKQIQLDKKATLDDTISSFKIHPKNLVSKQYVWIPLIDYLINGYSKERVPTCLTRKIQSLRIVTTMNYVQSLFQSLFFFLFFLFLVKNEFCNSDILRR